MAYGIEELISDGIPATVFPGQTTFYQVGDRGKLHSQGVCNRNATSVNVQSLSIREKDLCSKCARGNLPVQYELSNAIRIARILCEAKPVLARAAAAADWNVVGDLNYSLCELELSLGQGNLSLQTEVDTTLQLVTAAIAEQRAALGIDIESWCQAAGMLFLGWEEGPDELAQRRAALLLPSYDNMLGPRDGLWLLARVRDTVVESLLAGHGWDIAAQAAHDRAAGEVTERGHQPTDALAGVVSAYLDLWRSRAEAKLAATTTDAVVVLGCADGFGRTGDRPYRRLLAPALTVEAAHGQWVTAIMPLPVAEALRDYTNGGSWNSPTVHIAGPVRDGDDLEVLEMLLKVKRDSQSLKPADALAVARGIATESLAPASTPASTPAMAANIREMVPA